MVHRCYISIFWSYNLLLEESGFLDDKPHWYPLCDHDVTTGVELPKPTVRPPVTRVATMDKGTGSPSLGKFSGSPNRQTRNMVNMAFVCNNWLKQCMHKKTRPYARHCPAIFFPLFSKFIVPGIYLTYGGDGTPPSMFT